MTGTANNAYLDKGTSITVTGTLTGTLGVTLASGYSGAFTSGLSGKLICGDFRPSPVSLAVFSVLNSSKRQTGMENGMGVR